ncbi:hypothetical protein FHX74_002396 [Friedmanniella endophytica]|uniref:Uncharacterized protein n=1 Tax=Microlunatus kandeliicorticis TaxID=1759536 RepID=A0A7W3IT66_9ACTN|nr:hypothetical protein [Microlunatus kandeliicorticis]MBA8794777.1 hypothetical protein [Microlunatus kandeliicorticis]
MSRSENDEPEDAGWTRRAAPTPDRAPTQVVRTCLITGLVAGLAVWWGYFPAVAPLVENAPPPDERAMALLLDAGAVGLVALAMLWALHVRYGRRIAPRLFGRLGLAVAAAALAGVPMIMGLARALGYHTDPLSMVLEVLLGALVLTAALGRAVRAR